jgi:hypothetical protein
MNQDEQHLNLLAIFHYILGGLVLLSSCIFLIYVVLGLAMVGGAMDGPDGPPEFLGWFVVAFGCACLLVGWLMGGLIVAAGVKLSRRTSRTFCLVVAGLECLNMPLGTILGIFTIIVLMRDSVRALFEGEQPYGPTY